ncbi:MAG TPA: peptidylprolyl isomerase A [Deltaproteobacteria bacterium]|jgi:peptidyl-prolyl cis-trans isomerase A (cyclophilin A)|nr:peptidylprolyl isomerase A [Deltaproteobacteria bacterium]
MRKRLSPVPGKVTGTLLTALVFVCSAVCFARTPATNGGKPVVVLATSLGDITLELDPEKAPITVENFLAYVDAGFFDGTIFHRVIPNFMIQGGGLTPNLSQKPTRAPIKNEADNGLKNDAGTIAMARTSARDSATAQFFINLKDNDFLNHGVRDFGYAVFGHVTQGMDVVRKIGAVPTGPNDVPLQPVLIKSAKRG